MTSSLMRLLADTSVFSAKETTLLSFTKATTQLFMFSASTPSFHDNVALVPEEGAVERVMWTVILSPWLSPPLPPNIGSALSVEQAEIKASTIRINAICIVLIVFIFSESLISNYTFCLSIYFVFTLLSLREYRLPIFSR